MMIEELIKSLRTCAENSTTQVCPSCPWALHQKGCVTAMVTAAADAIEELEEKCQALAETLHAYEHPWIPVTERLPESGVHVLAACRVKYVGGGGRSYVCDAFYSEHFKEQRSTEYDDIELDYDEETDEYYLPEGWWEVIRNWDEYGFVGIEDFVTHWMPLPEPPKMENEK